MIAIGEHRAPPPGSRLALADRGVEVLGRRDLEALHPGGELCLVIRLHEQVDVRALDAEVDDPEVLALRGDERGLADRLVDAAPLQVADRADDPQHDVDRIARVEIWPSLVRRPRARAPGRPAGPAPLAAALLPQDQLLGRSGLTSSLARSTCRRHPG
ncbi:MAG TPA: hypothetical protein VK607_26800 [Kofleriaceae bacterium]|nr:hypothetical protein [Kofleriaceae bacterium]